MADQLEEIFAKLREICDFADVDFSDVNACRGDGDSGLHCVVGWGDLAADNVLSRSPGLDSTNSSCP
jgi:hypothetical protein